jgi:hypothetical protein
MLKASLKLELETVVCQFHAGRELPIHCFVLYVVAQVSQIRLSGFQPADNFDSLVDAQVGGMWSWSESIKHQHIKPTEKRPTFVRNLTHIGAVRDIADPKAEHTELRVNQGNGCDLLVEYREGFLGDLANLQFWDVAGGEQIGPRSKCVRIRFADFLGHFLGAIKGHRTFQVFAQRPDIIQPEEMVCVIVRVHDCMNGANALTKKLQAKLGSRIDQDISAGRADENRASIALILGIRRSTHVAATADHGYANGCARAEKSKRARLEHASPYYSSECPASAGR